ncbi:hypothetical protein MATL_G00216720 [Megalops atlanticus]|uniref:CASK interacting protein 1 n=1 Tax=Megalops atlanticus TaxID=7932 RepID=A0A9D3SXZ8_MEGAT|nr:hypothetical protein MATL_G00216720 [Megalops atlanticus]
MGKDQELLQAVKTEDLITVQKLLQRPKPGKAKLLGSAKKVNVNFQDTDGFSALHHAALNGNLELISLLLESQATVDIRDQKGMRPLHYAAWQGKAEPMKMLLKSGSSVNGQSDEGQIPLHLAAQHGHYDVSEMLLQHQSNPCIVDIAGKTPLDLACEFGRVGVVQLLLNSNMCAALLEPKPGDSTDPNGTSPLHLAAKNGHIDIIRLLIQAGIDINRQTKSGTALHEAALCGKTEVVRLLLDSGINAAVRNTYSQTALDIVHQFTATQASREIKQMLRDASAALQVRALKDYCNNYDLTSLNIKAGDVITVLEQHPDGRWKGCIHDNRTGNDRVGYFPSNIVEVISKRAGSWNAVICPQQYLKIQLTVPACGPAAVVNGDSQYPQFHVLPPPPPPPPHSHQPLFTSFGYSRSPGTSEELHCGQGGDRSSVGSSGSMASARSSGSGQSAGSSAHALHAQAEGVKLLATVLSQSAKAKEHLLEQSKSVEQSTGSSSRTLSSSSCPFHEQPHGEAAPQRKGEVPSEGKDLTAIGVTKPGHRKKMASEINKLSFTESLPDHKPADLAEWLSLIGLGQYYQVLVHNGYENIDFITDITWEDLQEIGITKLGHQKKLMMAVKKLAELQKASEGRGAQRKKASQSSEAAETPPLDGAECMSPKMSTFQDSELSGELQAALSRAPDAQEGSEVKQGGDHMTQRARSLQENSLGKSRESEEGGGPPRKEARVARQSSQGLQRANAPPALSKPRQSFPPGGGPSYTPPQTPTKTKPSSPQTTAPPQASSKMKPTPQQHLSQAERPPSARSLPQSPTHRGHAHATPQPVEAGEGPPAPGPPVSVPLLCLPPEGDEAPGEPGTPKKRAHSLVRYAASDSEQDRDELAVPDAAEQNRVSRSNSVRGQSDKGASRAQAIALRQRKKGPPPPPPKRSSSAISSASLADEPKEEVAGGAALLDVPYHQQRRASDLGGAVDTGSAGSVRSIAAMLEMSSIGGGAKALAMQKPLMGGGHHYLQVSPDRARVAVHHGGKHREGIGLDGEVVNRRRTISGPVTELVAAARRERGPQEPESPRSRAPPDSSAENLPFAEDGNLTIKQRPRQGRGEGEPEGDGLLDGVYSLPHEELSRMDATATLKRRPRPKHQQDGVKFQLTESSTVKRRPKSKDKDSEEQDGQLLVPYQNGTGTIKRRPASDAGGMEQTPPQDNGESAPRRDSTDMGSLSAEGTPRKPVKPPVSPKPVLAQHMRKAGPLPPSAKRVPIPGPGGGDSPGTEVKRAPPAVSPKPTPPPTAPKPAKVQNVLQPVAVAPSPAPSPAKQPSGRAPGTPPLLSPGPAKPPTGLQQKLEETSGPRAEAVQQKLEETSASLAAALQAVEEKIKQEDSSVVEDKSTGSILDDIGSMFDDLADQLEAMLE